MKKLINLLLFIIPSCSFTDCENSLLYEKLSPRRDVKIIVFSRACNATTEENYQVAIIERKKYLTNNMNPFLIMDKMEPDVIWIDNNTIQITIPQGARVFKKEDRYENFSIRYICGSQPQRPFHANREKE